jgi:hypothetical protein
MKVKNVARSSNSLPRGLGHHPGDPVHPHLFCEFGHGERVLQAQGPVRMQRIRRASLLTTIWKKKYNYIF